ncbi:hypothetical protein [Terriglobus sp.]|uniref:hypothetical protein n=1 Tax=Terriglobus sp. TaxID=1889013 RepID=UPI003B00676D
MKRWGLFAAAASLLGTGAMAGAQQCTTQSKMQTADRTALLRSATGIASAVQANDSNAVRQQTLPDVAQNFAGIANAIASAAPHLTGATFVPDTLWILDARASGPNAKPADTQFFCNLNGGSQSTVFSFQALPPGRYGLAVLDAPKAQPPYQLTLLLREESAGTWQLGGFFPRVTTAAGHDGIWYWKAARTDAAKRQNWNAWLNYSEAERLLRPAAFVSSSHLEQLQEEQGKSAPAALSGGLGQGTPLIVKAKDGTEYRVTALAPDDSLGGDRIDIAMHYSADTIADPVAARARNQRAAAALLAAYPELRDDVHGVWVYAEPASGPPYVSEEPVSSLR